jgi:hypothetical protein
MDWIKRNQSRNWVVPVILLVLTILAYGLLIPGLGFYFDDWPVIYMIQSGGDFWEFYQYDRPFSAWTYVLTAPILGTSSFRWHGFTLLIRWVTSCLVWWLLRLIWPKHPTEVTWAALIFSVHPVFLQQSIAVAYSQHFITYALFFLSCGTMLAAVQKQRHAWLLTTVSLLSAALHIFTMEYFWGLELVRPLLLWLSLSNQKITTDHKLKRILYRWLPYGIILSAAIIWRVGFYSQSIISGEDPNSLRFLELLKTAPLNGIMKWFEMATRDFIFLMISAWSNTIRPSLIHFEGNILGYSWVLAAISVLLILIYRAKLIPLEKFDPAKVNSHWNWQAIAVGIAIFFAGTIPVWLTDKYISLGMYSDRFALPGMWGASILVVGGFSSIGVTRKYRGIIFSIMIGLAIGAQFRVANDYRWDWINQQRFFWQLSWRAPALEPGTAIFSDGAVFSFTGDYPTAFAINTFYDGEETTNELPYWFIELDRGFHNDPVAYLEGYPLQKSLRNYSFRGNSLKSILLYYNPGDGNCLWVLDERDRINNAIPALTQDALPLSDTSRISTTGQVEKDAIARIFGSEPEHQWCYYYQKAEVAYQEGNWEQITHIFAEVNERGYAPNNQLEWIPFIDAYARLGLWNKASELTLSAHERAPDTRKSFCSLWESYQGSDWMPEVDPEDISEVLAPLACP